jgi:hypothetical protein
MQAAICGPGRSEGTMISDKIRPQHLDCKAISMCGNPRPSGPIQSREPSAAIRHARSSGPHSAALRSRSSTTISAAWLQATSCGPASSKWWRRFAYSKIGPVAAREVSRFARNSHDWQQLIEMCRVVNTVLVDQETVYAPRQGNDRLLLGLKGSLNEYELDFLRQRSTRAKANHRPVRHDRTGPPLQQDHGGPRMRDAFELGESDGGWMVKQVQGTADHCGSEGAWRRGEDRQLVHKQRISEATFYNWKARWQPRGVGSEAVDGARGREREVEEASGRADAGRSRAEPAPFTNGRARRYAGRPPPAQHL